MRAQRIASRPHVQGSAAPLRLRHASADLSDAAGLVLLRKLWDQLDLGRGIDAEVKVGGQYRPSLMVEAWVALSFYGGSHMDHLPWLEHRGVRRLFGWQSVPDATTYGRWLRRAGEGTARKLDQLLWRVVRARWQRVGVPREATVVMDSTVVERYGSKQAGAEVGYNPQKPGRPSHHPLLAYVAETGDCLGVRWRAGSAHTAEGAPAWLESLVGRLRAAGVEEITVRLDKGFFSKAMVQILERLGVRYVLKVPAHKWVRRRMGALRRSRKHPRLWTGSAPLYGGRLLCVEKRREIGVESGELELGSYEVEKRAYVLTNLPGVHALSALRLYNRGAVVESRIKEMGQLGVGGTAVDDLGGNALLWAMGALAYQLLHVLRTTTLTGAWKRAEPKRLRAWLFRMPAKLVTHARKQYVHLVRGEPLGGRLLRALRCMEALGPPLPT